MICAIVLAAGRSRRMGTQKLLLPVAGQPMIARIVDEVLRSPVAQSIVVVGHDRERVTEALAGRHVEFATNTCADGGMLSSVRCGLRALPEGWAAALVVLGDQPAIRADVVAALIRGFRTGQCGIVVPTCRGQRGHPVLIAARHRDELLNQHDAVGLRGLLQAHPADVNEVEVAAPGILQDVDVPSDFQRVLAGLSSQSTAPTRGCGGRRPDCQ